MASTSHQSPLVWIPPKQTEDVDIAAAVRSLISSSYGEDPKNYSQALVALARARTDATSHTGSDTTARDLLFKWFHILEMLEVRFPELRVPFTWKDAFTNKPISQFSLAYEKASVIFNIASTLSAVASAGSRLSSSPSSDAASAPSPVPTSPLASKAPSIPNPADSDGTKRAYTALRQAAGFFSYINQNFLHAPSTDMSRDLLRFLVSLMLTQANEVFLEKTLNGKSSPGLVAKLAHGVAKGYAELAEKSKDWHSQEIVDRTWTMLLNTKAKHYLSITQYYKGQADIAASNHGHALVRFTIAEALSKEAVKFANQFSANYHSSGPSASASTTLGYTNPTSSAYTFPSDAGQAIAGLASTHLAIVSQRRAEAVKDNDLIYHDILPSESTLPAIDETSPAQAISIQEVYSSPETQRVVGPDLFSKLVPLGVHERASMYSEEKAKLARAEAERCDSAEGERVAALDGMGLPAGLEKFRAAIRSGGLAGAGLESLADPGPEVMAWSEEEASGGPARGADGIAAGAKGVNTALSRILSLSQINQVHLDNAAELLNEESRLCEKARVKFGHKFGQEPSGGQSEVKILRNDIKATRETLRQAQENNTRIEARWREIQHDVELLDGGRSALEQAFAEALASSDANGSGSGGSNGLSLLDLSESDERQSAESLEELKEKVEAVESALSKLAKVKKERDSLLTELREKLQSDDIGHLLILSHRGGSSKSANASGDGHASEDSAQAAHEAALFRQELEKFRPWQNRLGQAYAAQAHLLADINKHWTEINTSAEGKRIASQWGGKARAREELVERLRQARDGNAKLRAALAKGLKWYEESDQYARELKESALKWNEDRGREREAMERQAEWDSKLNVGQGDENGLERSMGSLGLGGGGGPAPAPALPQRQSSYGFSPSPSPSLPPAPGGPARSYASPPPLPGAGAAGTGLPPPPPRPYSSFSNASANSGTPQPSYYSQPPPQPPQQSQQPPRSPYDFSNIRNGPLATDTSRDSPAPQSNQYSHHQPSYGGYQQPPPPPPQGGYGYSAGGGLPPPPPRPNQQQYGQSQSQPQRTPSYGGPPPPPAPTPSQYGSGYQTSLPPPPSQPTYNGYGSGNLPPPPLAPTSSSYYQYQQQPQPAGGYQNHQQASSAYQHPPPPPPQQQQGQWRGY